jgi:hypothetical protein
MNTATRSFITIAIITVASLFLISSGSDPDLNDGSLYILDLEDESTYEMTCYDELSGGNWSVKNQSCTLTTSIINLPGNPGSDPAIDIPINFFAHRTGNLEAEDNIVLQYKTGDEWTTIVTIPGTDMGTGATEYSFRADNIPAGSAITFRFIVQTDNASEMITMKFRDEENTVFVGTPFFAGTDEYFRPVELPVCLKDFFGLPDTDGVMLSWSTMTEINNKQFEIERSTNGYDFSTVTIVAGAGNSNTLRYYEAKDFSPVAGTSYYRLKQTDFNGDFAYSDLISVNVEKKEAGCILKTIPNPCIGRCSFVMENCDDNNGEKISFFVFDALGNIVYSETGMIQPGSTSFAFNSENGLSPGVYIVRGMAGNKELEDKFIYQN